ncbi:hypothetical protein [Mangrovihabitans endophyticus]|uniref:3-keto-disaccharide hydrolase domain-containing protein n=1 Tax=Mangrovihabitans endophyticus TaxID=1751298 RepID=A0A8J3C5B6_9ACTN|nr:hypothetical protein [Mangrovihabitans endophyticus]GGL17150.1 hypothetical protein GCM10012284_59670 [Mangrovihabitans endophyticus]
MKARAAAVVGEIRQWWSGPASGVLLAGEGASPRLSWRQWTILVAVATVAVTAQVAWWSRPHPFQPSFGDSGLITNELLERHPDVPGVRRSDDWVLTSGSLFADDGMGYSGRPDDGQPDALSGQANDSAVFRAVSRRRDFADVRVRLRVRIDSLVSTARTPEQDYDGLHLFLRYRSPQELYVVSLQRRDGTVAIKRKIPGGPSNGGSYQELAGAELPLRHEWLNVEARVRDAEDGSTRFVVRVDGQQVLSATDASPRRLAGPGGVGLRGDNAEFHFADFIAEPIDS